MLIEITGNLARKKKRDVGRVVLVMKVVRKETAAFFNRHWGGVKPPVWSENPYTFQGEIPNGTSRGCYALLEGRKVVYIGLGVKRGKGRYEGHGIDARLKKGYLRAVKRKKSSGKDQPRVPVKKWASITAIYTIGFPEKYSYLANSLEAYLLLQLSPERNINLIG